MAKGYIVSIHTKIIDEEKLKLYGVHAKSALEANAGRYVARGSNISKLEGIPLNVVPFLSLRALKRQRHFMHVRLTRGRRKTRRKSGPGHVHHRRV